MKKYKLQSSNQLQIASKFCLVKQYRYSKCGTDSAKQLYVTQLQAMETGLQKVQLILEFGREGVTNILALQSNGI